MKTSRVELISLCLLPALFFGCSRSNVDTTSASNATLGDKSIVLVSSGTDKLSQNDLDRMVALRIDLTKRIQGHISQQSEETLRKGLLANGIAKFEQDVIVSRYAKEHGILATEEEIQQTLLAMLKTKKTAALDKFLGNYTESERATLRDLAISDILHEKVQKAIIDAAKITVSDEEVAARRKNIQNYNARMAQTNDLVYLEATNCWRSITSGELTFSDAADKYDQSDDFAQGGCFWGKFSLDFFSASEEQQLRSWLSTAKAGDVSPPLEGDNGLIVVQLEDVEANYKDGDVMAPNAYYTLNRIYFKLPLFFPERTDQELLTDLHRIKARKVIQHFMEEQRKKAMFIYHQGTSKGDVS